MIQEAVTPEGIDWVQTLVTAALSAIAALGGGWLSVRYELKKHRRTRGWEERLAWVQTGLGLATHGLYQAWRVNQDYQRHGERNDAAYRQWKPISDELDVHLASFPLYADEACEQIVREQYFAVFRPPDLLPPEWWRVEQERLDAVERALQAYGKRLLES